jgi:adenosine deaminase CECR1
MTLSIIRLSCALFLLLVCAIDSLAIAQSSITSKQQIVARTTTQSLWFEKFKQNATDKQLYSFLYSMPKGVGLHSYSSGSNLPQWWFELALTRKINGGYSYYTRTKITLCNGYGINVFGFTSQALTFQTISESTYKKGRICKLT